MRFSLFFTFFFCASILFSGVYHKAWAQKSSQPQVGVFFFKHNDAYVNLVSLAIKKGLQDKATFTFFDANNNQVLQKEQITRFLQNDVDAVAINLVDVKVSQDILNIVRKKNIPVIFFNKEPDSHITKTYEKARYVGTNASQSGIIQGEIIANLWKEHPEYDRNNDGVCNFIMLQGGLDNPEALLRTRTSVQKARELGINMQQLGDTIICHWDAECAYNASMLALDLYYDEVDFIISNNDDMAIGAIAALQRRGFNTPQGAAIPVVGIDAIDKAKKAMAQKSMHGTVLQDAQSMGSTIAAMLINASANKPFLENVPYAFDEDGISVRIPYKAYENP